MKSHQSSFFNYFNAINPFYYSNLLLKLEISGQKLLNIFVLMLASSAIVSPTEARQANHSTFGIDELPFAIDTQAYTTGVQDLKNTIEQLPISASPAASTSYKKSPQKFFADKKVLIDMLNDLSQNRMTECKIRQLATNKNLALKLVLPEEIPTAKGYSAYNYFKQELLFKPITEKQSAEYKPFLLRALHIAGRHQSAIRNKENFSPREGHYEPVPYNTLSFKEDMEFSMAIEEGIKNIDYYLKLLSPQSTHLTSKEKDAISILKPSVKGYLPAEGIADVNADLIALWQEKNLVSKNLVVKKPFFYQLASKSSIPYFCNRIQQKSNGQYQCTLITVDDESQSLLAALRDCKNYLTLNSHVKSLGSNQEDINKDANIHQIFQLYPQAFQMLFPKLLAFHFKKADSEYKACLRM